jgi:hypothetical protein
LCFKSDTLLFNNFGINLETGLEYKKKFVLENNMRIFVFGFLFVLVLTLCIPTKSYAMDESGKVKWKLIFLSPYSGCTNYQYQMTNQYDEITSKYFDLYKFENSKYQPECIPDEKYTSYKPPKDLDLLVLVYDNEIGKKDLRSKDIGGLYNHVGNDRTKNHTIIICDCSNFGYSDPVWALSHELSHFITYYLGFDLSIVENKIHSVDAKYDQCIEGNRDASCSGVTTHLTGDYYFTHATVMAPYGPAIGKKSIATENNTVNNGALGNIATSPVVMNMQKEITKWWLAGKINDTEYSAALGDMIGKSKNVMTGDNLLPPNVIFQDSPNGKKEHDTFYDLVSNKTQKELSVLNRVPFKVSTNLSDLQIPQWFKVRANLWLQGKDVNNNDFVNGIIHLFDMRGKNNDTSTVSLTQTHRISGGHATAILPVKTNSTTGKSVVLPAQLFFSR